MMRHLFLAASLLCGFLLSTPNTGTAASLAIVCVHDASPLEKLAAKEVRRYVYLRTGKLLWEGQATASSQEQEGSGGGGLVGLLVEAEVSQIANSIADKSYDIAGITSNRLLSAGTPNGILYGPRSPNYAKQK